MSKPGDFTFVKDIVRLEKIQTRSVNMILVLNGSLCTDKLSNFVLKSLETRRAKSVRVEICKSVPAHDKIIYTTFFEYRYGSNCMYMTVFALPLS